MNRDPHDPRLKHLPEVMRERATKLEYGDNTEATSLIRSLQTQFAICVQDVDDTLARHRLHFQALEDQLRTALDATPDQSFQYDQKHAYILDATALTGEALARAQDLGLARFKLQMLAHLYAAAHQEVSLALERIKKPLEAAVLEAGLDPEKCALLNTHILAFDPLEAPIGSTGGVKA